MKGPHEDIFFFLLLICSGKPKYFPAPHFLLISRIAFVASLILHGVFDENVIADLLLFIFCCPDALLYSKKILISEYKFSVD